MKEKIWIKNKYHVGGYNGHIVEERHGRKSVTLFMQCDVNKISCIDGSF